MCAIPYGTGLNSERIHFTLYRYPDWKMVHREVIRNELPLLVQEAREPDLNVHLQLSQQDVSQLPGFFPAHTKAGGLLPKRYDSLWTKEASS